MDFGISLSNIGSHWIVQSRDSIITKTSLAVVKEQTILSEGGGKRGGGTG